jgi:DNA repair protein RecO (recombination protein O)
MATSRSTAPIPAFVLHRYDWSETSLIVDLFTRPLGRVVVAAKGAKRPTSQLRPVLLPFQILHAHLGKAPKDDASELRLLRTADWVGGAPLLNAAAMFPGFYLNELLMKLLARQDPYPALFDTYVQALAALATDFASGLTTANDGAEVCTLRAFELALLRALGLLPDLAQVTLTTQPLQPDQPYTLQAENGLVSKAHGVPGAAWVQIEAALAHGSFAALRLACSACAAGLRGPLRALLHYHLGASPLRTRQVWMDVQKIAGATQTATHPVSA